MIVFIITNCIPRIYCYNRWDIDCNKSSCLLFRQRKNNATNANTKKIATLPKNNRKSFSKSPLIPFITSRLLSTSESPDRVIRFPLQFPDNFLYNTASHLSDRQFRNFLFSLSGYSFYLKPDTVPR